MYVYNLLMDSVGLILISSIRYLAVLNERGPASSSNSSAPRCHTVVGLAKYSPSPNHSGGAKERVPTVQRQSGTDKASQ